jgi:hypothetical protein
MDLGIHTAIAGMLEASKSGGWLSDYLVAWHGPSGQLSPNVTVWHAADRTADEVKSYIAELLAGFVPQHDITVEGDA